MKNRRDVCFAKDAGYIAFSGLPGTIKTGCQATPAYKSRYCEDHKHFACDSQQLTGKEDEDWGIGFSNWTSFAISVKEARTRRGRY